LEHQLTPAGHAPCGIWVIALDPFANTLKVVGRRFGPANVPQGCKRRLQALADLLMCQVLAALHGLNKAGFFLEIPSNDYRRNLIRGAALLRRGAR